MGSLTAVRSATVEQLMEKGGVPRKLATAIAAYYGAEAAGAASGAASDSGGAEGAASAGEGSSATEGATSAEGAGSLEGGSDSESPPAASA
jgi:hypothetical protein